MDYLDGSSLVHAYKAADGEYFAQRLFESVIPEYDASSQHHTGTAARFVKMLKQMTEREEFQFTTFDSDSDEMVVVRNVPFYALCAHHIIPFFGIAHVAYVPDGKIVGLSKIPRTIKYFSKGLWAQEELTATIATFLQESLEPKGVAVIMQGRHMCMEMRGVESQGDTTTSAMRGVFADHTRLARSEFLSLVYNS